MWKLCPHFPDTVVRDGQWNSRLRMFRYAVLTQAAVVAGILAGWTCPVKVDLTDAADVVLGNVPSPGRDRVPLLNFHFHDGEPVGWRNASKRGIRPGTY